MEDLYPQDKRGKITAKGGATEWIPWQSGTAQLLPRLIARGPLFLTNRKAPAGTPTLDVCPETGWARLSYRRAEEIFVENTRLLANPLASPDDIEDLDGWTLHRLRHSALTHDAEDGTSIGWRLARSWTATSSPFGPCDRSDCGMASVTAPIPRRGHRPGGVDVRQPPNRLRKRPDGMMSTCGGLRRQSSRAL
ncbi:hypothetical protein ACFW9I_08465 [[Kitasatospora] papulosa]|uniref:hypothetical protein n=1 Tax=[Kitasatospora] papulosa TaxID=1464011 RepID=UPI00369B67DA